MASWTKVREQVLERDGFTCQECGGNEKLQAHHIKARYDGGDDSIENLRTLCRKCHTDLHTKELQEYKALMDRIGAEQYKALMQCQKDYLAQGGDIYDQRARSEFSKNWPGWADVPQYP